MVGPESSNRKPKRGGLAVAVADVTSVRMCLPGGGGRRASSDEVEKEGR